MKASATANKRGAARLAAIQALYQMDIAGSGVEETVTEYEAYRLGAEMDGETYLVSDVAWFRAVVGGVVSAQRDIDPLIHRYLPKSWPLSRIEAILRAILRAGVFELTANRGVPSAVVISEYVDLAKAFFAGDEPKMVNGVLDAVASGAEPMQAGEPTSKTADEVDT